MSLQKKQVTLSKRTLLIGIDDDLGDGSDFFAAAFGEVADFEVGFFFGEGFLSHEEAFGSFELFSAGEGFFKV